MAETAYAEPSLLPDWTRGDVVAHLALNAEGMAGALHGLTEGTSCRCTPPRRHGTATSPPSAVRDPRRSGTGCSAGRPTSTTRWPRSPRTSGASTSSASPAAARSRPGRLPGMRHREVEIHHADLGLGYTHADWPPAFAVRPDRGDGQTRPPGAVDRARHRRGPHLAPRRRWTDRARTRRRARLVADRSQATAPDSPATTGRCPGSRRGDLHRERDRRRRARRARADPPDHHQGGRRQGDVQQRLPAPLPAHG